MSVEQEYQRGDQLIGEARAHIGYLLLEAVGAGLAGWLVWEHVVKDIRVYGLDWTMEHKPLWLWAMWAFVAYWGVRWATWAARNLSAAAYKYPLGRRLKGRTLGASIVAGLVVAAVMVIPNSSMSTFMTQHPGEVNDVYQKIRCALIAC